MRFLALATIGMALIAPPALAQTADKLDLALRGWEKAMLDLQSFAVGIERVNIDKSLDTKDTHHGFAMFTKADKIVGIQAHLKLTKSTNKDVFEEYLYKGGKLFEFAPAAKVVRVHQVPKGKVDLQQESLLSFLFEMGVKEAKARYKLDLEEKQPADGYIYIHIEPKQAHDKREFVRARLALARANHLLAQIWYVQRDGNEVTWNFSQPQINVDIPAANFTPVLPNGWRFEEMKAAPLIRDKNP